MPEELQDLNGYVTAVKVRQQLRQGLPGDVQRDKTVDDAVFETEELS